MYLNVIHNVTRKPIFSMGWGVLFLIFCFHAVSVAQEYHLSPLGKITFAYENVIGVETYAWRSTLISYPVFFSGEIQADYLRLINKRTGKEEQFQLSEIKKENGWLRSADISFMTELPYQGAFEYEFFVDKIENKALSSNNIPITETDGTIEIKGSKIQIRLPKTSSVEQHTAPAPLIAVSQGDGWIGGSGNNTVISPKKKIRSIQSETVEHGALFVRQQIRYAFEGGAEYLVQLTLIRDYPFVILDETMTAFAEEDQVSMEMVWEGFEPTKRFGTQWDRNLESIDAWLDIDKPVYTGYCKEDPRWTGMGWIENPAEKMIFRLTSFGGNSVREQTPVMSFWEETGKNRELGVFVYDFNRWNDQQYGIWQPSTTLSVYFRYTDHKLHFTYPLASGTRSTAISFFPKEEGLKQVADFNSKLEILAHNGGKHKPADLFYRYSHRLMMEYASLSLNRVKDWQLSYPENAPRPANPFIEPRPAGSKDEFVKQISSSPMAYYPMGLNGYPGIHSIEHRIVYTAYVEDYLRYYQELTPVERRRTEALLILAAYVNPLEEMNAIRHSLAGTPNMAADGWCVPPQVAFLFPEHSMANEWMDFFEKSLELSGLFYTRPDVKTYESKGGRWTESLGIYNWAYLRPVTHSNIAAELYDGENRYVSPYMVTRGDWMLNMLTAPIDGKGRCFPPHGAHGSGYLVQRLLPVYQTAQWLEHYDPILAENLFWTGEAGIEVEKKPVDTDWHTPYEKMYPKRNNGTNPHLKSCKYTGHGIVLRSGVDTGEELSIHLNQVDKGPNYRWGNQGEGNTGGLYFYAKGKVYTAHENEIAGDHIVNNLDGLTNFGVMKNGEYRTVGMNELKAPLYDFVTSQFAELLSNTGEDKYVWPDYLSRSVMLVGTDYFILFDEVGTNWRGAGRFAWFNRNGEAFPKITFLSEPARKDAWMKAQTPNSNGFYRDNFGSLLTLVTHKKHEVFAEGGQSVAVPFLDDEFITDFRFDKSAGLPVGVVPIKTRQSNDLIFRNGNEINYTGREVTFKGKAGLIRRFSDGKLELSLFKGEAIGTGDIHVALQSSGQSAISITRELTGVVNGMLKTDAQTTVKIEGLSGGKLYVNGREIKFRMVGNIIEVSFPAGEYRLEYTRGKAIPLESRIASVEYEKDRVKLYITHASPCEAVLIQLSADGGKTWQTKGRTSKEIFYLPKGETGKVHVRALAVNGTKEAVAASEYPVYFTDTLPHYPEGLWLKLSVDEVALSWGEVLGAQTYRLYRRVKGETEYRLVYEGKERQYTDKGVSGVRKAFAYPGSLDNRKADRSRIVVYEYAISTLNGNGESTKSPAENTDPASWRNWYPDTELKFKRQSAFWLPPYVYPNMVPGRYYPD